MILVNLDNKDHLTTFCIPEVTVRTHPIITNRCLPGYGYVPYPNGLWCLSLFQTSDAEHPNCLSTRQTSHVSHLFAQIERSTISAKVELFWYAQVGW